MLCSICQFLYYKCSSHNAFKLPTWCQWAQKSLNPMYKILSTMGKTKKWVHREPGWWRLCHVQHMFSKVILKPTSIQQSEGRRVEDPKGGFYGSFLEVMHITFSHISLAQILLTVIPNSRGGWGILSSCVSWWKEKQVRQTPSQPLPHCPRSMFQPISH